MPNIFSDPSDVTPELAAARKAKYGNLGTGSFVVDLGANFSGKKNKAKFLDKTYEGMVRPLMNADERAGAAISKVSPSWIKDLLTRKEMLPLAGKDGMHVLRKTKALSEPLMKVKGVGVPIAAAMALGSMMNRGEQAPARSGEDEELLRQLSYYYDDPAFQKAGAVMSNKQGLMKEAAQRIETLTLQNQDAIEKLAAAELDKQATDVVWDMVERGHVRPPSSRTEFQEKVAMVAVRGPELTRAALDFAPTLPDFMIDKAASAANSAEDPLTHFVHTGEI
tara:strand:+ start:1905 stop:2741 length:837 start_codon:yes stop_codon:yes gene_type:complete